MPSGGQQARTQYVICWLLYLHWVETNILPPKGPERPRSGHIKFIRTQFKQIGNGLLRNEPSTRSDRV